MNVEERLRGALADERYAVPGWPDPVDRIREGVQRRKRRRRAVVAGSLAVVALAAVGVPSMLRATGDRRPADPADSAALVPWQDVPVPVPTGLARRSARPDARACAAPDLGDLAWTEAGEGTGDGSRRFTVLVANKSDTRCTLRGTAQLTTRGHVNVPSRAAQRPDAVSQTPATIDPGEPARIDVVSTQRCDKPSDPPVHYRDLEIGVLGRRIPVSELTVDASCPLEIGDWRVLPPLLNLPYLVASIKAPGQIQRGETLDYEVALLNFTDGSYRLEPCPVFVQMLAGQATADRLNCTRPTIKAHSTARFEMRISVPPDTPPGDYKLTWMAAFSDGRVATADLANGGVVVGVTG